MIHHVSTMFCSFFSCYYTYIFYVELLNSSNEFSHLDNNIDVKRTNQTCAIIIERQHFLWPLPFLHNTFLVLYTVLVLIHKRCCIAEL